MNQIKVDLERVISDIDRNIFGGYLDIFWQDPEFGYIEDDDVPRSDLRAALERVKFPILRWPGGNDASGYHWMDGVGARKDRPKMHDLTMNRIVSNYYGTNEFCRFCRKLNIEPNIIVNCGDGDMREAADWVEYCNSSGDSALVKLRRKHGFEEPHKVKYWSIGNEVDGPWEIGYKTPQEYARAVTEFSKVMKRVDPDIKLIASAISRWEDHPPSFMFMDRKTEWVERTQLMLEQAGDRIDYMAIHRGNRPYPDDPFETFMAWTQDFNERLSAYAGLILAVSLERGIKHAISIAVDEYSLVRRPVGSDRDAPIDIAVDEWGVSHLPIDEKQAHRRRERILNLEDALGTALYLNAYIRHACSVRYASFFPIPTKGISSLGPPDKPIVLQTVFYPFELYSQTCGKLALDVFWKGETFSGTYNGNKYTGIRTLDVAATLDQLRNQLVIYVVNQSKEEALKTTISLANGEFKGRVKVSVINGTDLKVENTIEKPNQVGVRETTLKASGKSFTYTFEPHSVTALIGAVS